MNTDGIEWTSQMLAAAKLAESKAIEPFIPDGWGFFVVIYPKDRSSKEMHQFMGSPDDMRRYPKMLRLIANQLDPNRN